MYTKRKFKDINKISISSKELENSWHLIDAKDKVLGRLASEVAKILMGKDKINYAPNLAGGDFVVVINASSIKVTGRKSEQKEYQGITNEKNPINHMKKKLKAVPY